MVIWSIFSPYTACVRLWAAIFGYFGWSSAENLIENRKNFSITAFFLNFSGLLGWHWCVFLFFKVIWSIFGLFEVFSGLWHRKNSEKLIWNRKKNENFPISCSLKHFFLFFKHMSFFNIGTNIKNRQENVKSAKMFKFLAIWSIFRFLKAFSGL